MIERERIGTLEDSSFVQEESAFDEPAADEGAA